MGANWDACFDACFGDCAEVVDLRHHRICRALLGVASPFAQKCTLASFQVPLAFQRGFERSLCNANWQQKAGAVHPFRNRGFMHAYDCCSSARRRKLSKPQKRRQVTSWQIARRSAPREGRMMISFVSPLAMRLI